MPHLEANFVVGESNMHKHRVKSKGGHAVRCVKRQLKGWTADTKGQAVDTAENLKDKAEHVLDQIRDAAREMKEKVTGG